MYIYLYIRACKGLYIKPVIFIAVFPFLLHALKMSMSTSQMCA